MFSTAFRKTLWDTTTVQRSSKSPLKSGGKAATLLSQGYPKNGIVEGDDYLRHPGQKVAYFRANDEPDWKLGSEQFRRVVMESGAPDELAEASIETLKEQNGEASWAPAFDTYTSTYANEDCPGVATISRKC